MSASTVSSPRFQLTINGEVLQGVSGLRVSLPYGFRVGQFDFSKAFISEDAFPASWWAATASKTMLVTVALSVDGITFNQVITGNVDNHCYDPISNSVNVAGRDLAAMMCDKRVEATYRNQTASQIAAVFAAEHGLDANITATTTLAGRYYDVDHDEIHSGNFSCATNEWDLLCRLGSEEGITPYVFGNTLNFNRPMGNPSILPISFSRNADGEAVANVTGLKLERHMTQARDVIVTVRSWNSRKKAGFSSTIRTKTKSPGGDADVIPGSYLVVVPNLTQAQCATKAQQLALDYSQQERNLSASFPSLNMFDPQSVVQLSGTGTDYDMTYCLDAVTYSLDFESGGRTDIFAKSSSDLALYDADTGEQIGGSSE